MLWKFDVECSFLWACIVLGEDLKTLPDVDSDYFLYPQNKEVFTAIYELLSEGVSIDLVTLSNKLQKKGKLEWIGWSAYLIELTNASFSFSSVDHYAKILKEEYKRIRFLKIAEKIKMLAESWVNINWSTFDVAKEILDLNLITSSENYNTENVIADTESYIEKNKWRELFGWRSWIYAIDKYAKGLQEWKTYRVGAGSNVGKTSVVAYNMINELIEQGAKVAFFSLENDREITMIKLLANKQKVQSDDIQSGAIAPNTEYIRNANGKFYLIDWVFDLSEIFWEILKIKPDVVILDYVGLVTMKKFKEEDKYTEYAKQVQQFVKRERVCWVDLNNLPKNYNEELMRSDWHFYGSSFLRNNADFGLFLFYTQAWYDNKEKVWAGLTKEQKSEYYNKQALTMFVSKNRLGVARQEDDIIVDYGKWAEITLVNHDDFASDVF